MVYGLLDHVWGVWERRGRFEQTGFTTSTSLAAHCVRRSRAWTPHALVHPTLSTHQAVTKHVRWLWVVAITTWGTLGVFGPCTQSLHSKACHASLSQILYIHMCIYTYTLSYSLIFPLKGLYSPFKGTDDTNLRTNVRSPDPRGFLRDHPWGDFDAMAPNLR